MTRYYHNEPSAPLKDTAPPVPPPRSDIEQYPQQYLQQDPLLLPKVPKRRDISPTRCPPPDIERRRDDDDEENSGDINNDASCNFNRYATIKTIGHGLLIVALLMSNAMQLRFLALQKQRDNVWIGSFILVLLSILIQLGLVVLLYMLSKGDIRNPTGRSRLERCNIFVLIIIGILAGINITINILMLTTNPKSFLDTHTLELLQQVQH